MKRFLQFIQKRYLGRKLDFRVRLFNILAMGGIVVTLIATAIALSNREPPYAVLANFIGCPVSWLLMRYASRTGEYQRCYILTIVFVFLLLFPAIFFFGGGYHGAMPSFFIFAVLFTIFMLDGKKAVRLALLELAVYTFLCIIAYRYPGTVTLLHSEQEVVRDIIFGFVTAGTVLGACLFLHFRLYNEQQKKLDEQNHALEQVSRMKTEFFASVSHEMKTPLTVISVHVQRARAFAELGREGDTEKVRESHALAQEEIMRLSRLVDSALRLSSLQELGGQSQLLDMRELLYSTSEAYRALLEQKNNTLTLRLPKELPPVSGSADALVQLLSNLLANANAHTQTGEITVRATYGRDIITVTIIDNGTGIAPELLGRVFERGVSGGEGSGFGLAICKQITENHGGNISIQSEPGKGTAVTLTLPIHKEVSDHA